MDLKKLTYQYLHHPKLIFFEPQKNTTQVTFQDLGKHRLRTVFTKDTRYKEIGDVSDAKRLFRSYVLRLQTTSTSSSTEARQPFATWTIKTREPGPSRAKVTESQ
jgi:hypothetical protein